MKALVLLAGPPGSGKSTWCGERFPAHCVVRMDDYRKLLTGSESDQSANTDAAEWQNTVVRHRMQRGLFTVVDATNARTEHRTSMVVYAQLNHIPIIVVHFNLDIGTCMDRQKRRSRQVPRDITEAIMRDLDGSYDELCAVSHYRITVYSDGTHRIAANPDCGEKDRRAFSVPDGERNAYLMFVAQMALPLSSPDTPFDSDAWRSLGVAPPTAG